MVDGGAYGREGKYICTEVDLRTTAGFSEMISLVDFLKIKNKCQVSIDQSNCIVNTQPLERYNCIMEKRMTRSQSAITTNVSNSNKGIVEGAASPLERYNCIMERRVTRSQSVITTNVSNSNKGIVEGEAKKINQAITIPTRLTRSQTRSQSAIAIDTINTNKDIVEAEPEKCTRTKKDRLSRILSIFFRAWKLHTIRQNTGRLEEHLSKSTSEYVLVSECRRYELELSNPDSGLCLNSTSDRQKLDAKLKKERKKINNGKLRLAQNEEIKLNQEDSQPLIPVLLSDAKNLSEITQHQWESKSELLLEIYAAHESTGRRCKTSGSRLSAHRLICVLENCSFQMDAAFKKESGCFEVTKYSPHVCEEIDFTKEEIKKKLRSYHMQAPHAFLVPALIPLMMQDPNTNTATVAATVKKYVKLDQSNHVLNRLKRLALESLESSKQEKVDDMHGVARLIKNAGFKCDVLSVDSNEMKKITVELDKAIHFHASKLAEKTSKDRLPLFDENNPETTEKLSKIVNGAQYYYGWRVYPENIIRHISNILVADAGFCDGDEEETFFSVHGSDANHKTVLLGAMKVSDNERYETWHLVLSGLLEVHPQFDAIGIVFLIDGDKGFQQAFEELFLLATFFFCSKHRGENFRKKFGHGAEANFNRCLQAATKTALSKKRLR